MPNVIVIIKKNLIIIKSIIVWKRNHLFSKNYFRKKKISYCYEFMPGNFQVICGSMVCKNRWSLASTETPVYYHVHWFFHSIISNGMSHQGQKLQWRCHTHQQLEVLTIWPTYGFLQFLRHLLFLWLDYNFHKLLLCLNQLCEDTGLNTGGEYLKTTLTGTNLNESNG